MNLDEKAVLDVVNTFAICAFVVCSMVDVIATFVLYKYSQQYPSLKSLRERRNVAAAIAIEVTLIAVLGINGRALHVVIDPVLQTLLVVLALLLPSIVTAVWLVRALRRQKKPTLTTADIDALVDDENRAL